MNYQFDHYLLSSFRLWLDNHILDKGQAYQNVTGQFFPTSSEINGLYTYQSSYPQFVYDSSVTGASVITGVYANNTFIGRGTSGLKIDYLNGRVFTSGVMNITGSFSKKEFNVYMNDKSAEVLIEEAFGSTREKRQKPFAAINPKNVIVPFINFTLVNSSNKPFAYGGEDETKTLIRGTIVTDNSFKMNGLLGLLRDCQYRCFSYVSDNQSIPFNYYNDLKTGGFNYRDFDNLQCNIYIDKVFVSRISEIQNDQGDLFQLGFCEFELTSFRYPRQ